MQGYLAVYGMLEYVQVRLEASSQDAQIKV
jgi:hypothetical protein